MRPAPALAALAALAMLAAAVAIVPAAAPQPGDAVRFLVLGDTGTGDSGQYQVAASALAVCQQRGCDLAIVNGDNIYENGVDGPNDTQFLTKFEQPYASFAIPFYLALGNHDNGGTVQAGDGSQNYKGDFEVQYAHRTDRPSGKWHMPARHYSFGAGPAQFWALDTNPLIYYGGLPVPGAPGSVPPVWLGVDPLGLQQLLWLQQGLAASHATWKFAFGHHPYLSNGQHGDAGMYDGVPTDGENVKIFIEQGACNAVDAYFAGHDHDLEWLKPASACGKTQFLISGAGSKTRTLGDPNRNPAYFQRGGTTGFWWVEATGDTLDAACYDGSGSLLFEQAIHHA